MEVGYLFSAAKRAPWIELNFTKLLTLGLNMRFGQFKICVALSCVLGLCSFSSFGPNTPTSLPDMKKSLPKMGKKQARDSWLFAIKTFIRAAKELKEDASDEWYQVGLIAKSAVEDGVSLSHLALLASECGCEALERAVLATQRIRELSSGLGISKSQLFQMAFYIETNMGDLQNVYNNYLSRRRSKFARTIEYDPQSRLTYIHLKDHGVGILGHGFKKTVTKSILYDVKKPEIVALCESNLPMPEEISALRVMQGAPGIVKVHSFTERNGKGRGKSYNIMCKLYRGGTLSKAFSRKFKFSFDQKMKIALDLLTGLEQMHSKGLVHRDVTARNMLLDYDKKGSRKVRNIKAVISDFGRTIPVDSAMAVAAQANSAYIPPEGILYEKLQGDDYYASDVYALGCVLHHLLTGKRNPWVDKINIRNLTKPVSVRQGKMTYDLQRYRKRCLAKLHKKGKRHHETSARDRFQRLTLKMIDPSPKMRGTARDLRKSMYDIFMMSQKKHERDSKKTKSKTSSNSFAPYTPQTDLPFAQVPVNDTPKVPVSSEKSVAHSNSEGDSEDVRGAVDGLQDSILE